VPVAREVHDFQDFLGARPLEDDIYRSGRFSEWHRSGNRLLFVCVRGVHVSLPGLAGEQVDPPHVVRPRSLSIADRGIHAPLVARLAPYRLSRLAMAILQHRIRASLPIQRPISQGAVAPLVLISGGTH
jgi:hypothetical protein